MSIRKIKFILLVGLCVLFAGCSTGRNSADGLQGSNLSDTDIGVRYLLGRGVVQSDAKAFSYFKSAASDDDPFAENELAYLYAAGKGTPRDYNKAFTYYQKAADHNLASAQYNLGLFYLYGLGTRSNKAMALHWFQRSAAHGFEPARVALARYRSESGT